MNLSELCLNQFKDDLLITMSYINNDIILKTHNKELKITDILGFHSNDEESLLKIEKGTVLNDFIRRCKGFDNKIIQRSLQNIYQTPGTSLSYGKADRNVTDWRSVKNVLDKIKIGRNTLSTKKMEFYDELEIEMKDWRDQKSLTWISLLMNYNGKYYILDLNVKPSKNPQSPIKSVKFLDKRLIFGPEDIDKLNDTIQIEKMHIYDSSYNRIDVDSKILTRKDLNLSGPVYEKIPTGKLVGYGFAIFGSLIIFFGLSIVLTYFYSKRKINN